MHPQPPQRSNRQWPLQLVRVSLADHVDSEQPSRALAIVGSGAVSPAWTRTARNVQRMHARMLADHLHQAATLMLQAPGPDVLLFAATGTAELLDVLRRGAEQCGAALPDDVVAAAGQLRHWAATLKSAAPPTAQPIRAHTPTWDGWQ